MGNKQGSKRQNKHSLLNKFLKVFIIAFTSLFIVIGIMTGAWMLIAKEGSTSTKAGNVSGNAQSGDSKNPSKGEEPIEQKVVTTFAIFGTDKEGYRTDVIMILFFNKETKKIDIVSVPRDTMIQIPDDLYQEISKTRYVNQTIKINEVPAYVEASKRNAASVAVIESSFGIDIDYYANLNLEGFREIVDLIGPIEVEIPFNMDYDDNAQGLHIHLKAGLQQLDGEKAEQLIRYRKGYSNGDLGRIDMQHEFMKAFMKELLTDENRLNFIGIASSALHYLDTDFESAIDYVNYIDDITLEDLDIYTLPGESKMLDRSYFIFDLTAAQELFAKIVDTDISGSNGSAQQILPADLVDIKTLKISVQNGTDIKGLAGSNKTRLSEVGYNVIEAVDYDNKPVKRTKLIVPSPKVGETLAVYFNNPEIEVDTSLFEQEKQVIIILGESDGQ